MFCWELIVVLWKEGKGKFFLAEQQVWEFLSHTHKAIYFQAETLTGITITNLGTHCNIFHSAVKFPKSNVGERTIIVFVSNFRLKMQSVDRDKIEIGREMIVKNMVQEATNFIG